MAAVTAAGRQEWVSGNKRYVMASLSGVDNTDTWDTGLRLVEHVDFAPTTSTAGSQIGFTRSGGTVTFNVEGGDDTLVGSAIAIGV
jgi:hypothetical protein